MNTASSLPSRWRQFNALTKPRVIQLIVFCALIVKNLKNINHLEFHELILVTIASPEFDNTVNEV